MKTILKTLLTLVVTLGVTMSASAGRTVSIKSDGCNFSMVIPEGWDTIPADTLRNKAKGNNILAGLYPKGQKGFFSRSYILIGYAPTRESLCGSRFDKIVKELKAEMSKQKLPHTDTLRVTTTEFTEEHAGEHYTVSNSTHIENDTTDLTIFQRLILTKYGYLAVAAYDKGSGTQGSSGIIKEVEKNIKIEKDFCYTEPESKSVFTIRNIIISLVVGLVAYLLIIYFDKKKTKCKK